MRVEAAHAPLRDDGVRVGGTPRAPTPARLHGGTHLARARRGVARGAPRGNEAIGGVLRAPRAVARQRAPGNERAQLGHLGSGGARCRAVVARADGRGGGVRRGECARDARRVARCRARLIELNRLLPALGCR